MSNTNKYLNLEGLSKFLEKLKIQFNVSAVDTDDSVDDIESNGGEMNVQSDWNETDSSSDAYILNKPVFKTINGYSILGSGNISVQDKLVSGTNIRTINNVPILGSGNISIATGDENVQSNWDETDPSSDAYIQNKPVFKTIAGHSILGSGNITLSAGEMNVQSNWNETDSSSDAYIQNKPVVPDIDSNGYVQWTGSRIGVMGGGIKGFYDGDCYYALNREGEFTDYRIATTSDIQDYSEKINLITGNSSSVNLLPGVLNVLKINSYYYDISFSDLLSYSNAQKYAREWRLLIIPQNAIDCQISFLNAINWANGNEPTFEFASSPSKYYELSFMQSLNEGTGGTSLYGTWAAFTY